MRRARRWRGRPDFTLIVPRLPASVGREQIDVYRDDMIQPARFFWMSNPLLTNLDVMRNFAALADLVHSELEIRPDWDSVRGFARWTEAEGTGKPSVDGRGGECSAAGAAEPDSRRAGCGRISLTARGGRGFEGQEMRARAREAMRADVASGK